MAQAETIEERTALARDILAGELRRVEAAVNAAGGDQFTDTCEFIRRQADTIETLFALVKRYVDCDCGVDEELFLEATAFIVEFSVRGVRRSAAA